jgi:flagellar assembly protein FliH
LSNQIIKAGLTRLLPAEMRRAHRSEIDDIEVAETAVPLTAEEIQAAYEEAVQAAQRKKEQILRDARRDSGEIVKKAREEAKKIREAAYSGGFVSGHEKGYADFLDNGEKAFLELMAGGQAEVDKALADVYAERDRLLTEMEPKILRLSLDIGEKILGYELDAQKEAFVSLVTTALNALRAEGRVTVRVSAAQHKASFKSKAEVLFKTELGAVEATVNADPGVEPGGCLIETGSGVVDASASTQLEQISRNLGFSD